MSQRRRTGRAAGAVDARVGRNIRAHRLVRRMSQSDLAEKIGVTFQQVQKYEKGTNRVSSGRLARIAEVLDLPVAILLGGKAARDESEPQSDALALLTVRDRVRLVQAFARIEDRVLRRTLVTLVERITAR